MSRLAYIGIIKDGKLYISSPRRAQMDLDTAKIKDGRLVEIELRPLPRRSDNQNKYYWSVVVAMVQEALQDLGHEVNSDQTHDFLKSKFNAKPVCNADGELIGEIGETTTRLNKSGFMDYLANIQRWAAEWLSITIPDPESQTSIQFK